MKTRNFDLLGVSKTFQLSKLNENGVMRKVVPVTNEQYTNKLTCFEVNGTANAKVTAQSVLPDTSQFQVNLLIILALFSMIKPGKTSYTGPK